MDFTSNLEINFKYEELARFAFDDCKKWGDPWGYAAQERYSSVQKADLNAKRILSTILTKLIFDYKDKSICEELKNIEESIWVAQSQKDVTKIILSTIATLERGL